MACRSISSRDFVAVGARRSRLRVACLRLAQRWGAVTVDFRGGLVSFIGRVGGVVGWTGGAVCLAAQYSLGAITRRSTLELASDIGPPQAKRCAWLSRSPSRCGARGSQGTRHEWLLWDSEPRGLGVFSGSGNRHSN